MSEGKNSRNVNEKPNGKSVKKPVEVTGGFYGKAEKKR
jgi:hypothetical protein